MPDLNTVIGRKFEGVPKMSLGTVTAVSDAEGLDVAYQGGGLVTGLQSHRAYESPGVGDVVVVCSLEGRMWVMDALDNVANNLGANLLPNPGFEFGVPGGLPSSWNSFWSTTSNDTRVDWVNNEAIAHSSGAAVQFTPGDLLDTQVQQLSMTDAAVVDPGAVYRVGAWWRGTSTDPNTTIIVRVITAATPEDAAPFGTGATVTDVATLSSPAAWTELAGLRTIPADHFYLRVFLRVVANAGHSATYVYADDVSMRRQT